MIRFQGSGGEGRGAKTWQNINRVYSTNYFVINLFYIHYSELLPGLKTIFFRHHLIFKCSGTAIR